MNHPAPKLSLVASISPISLNPNLNFNTLDEYSAWFASAAQTCRHAIQTYVDADYTHSPKPRFGLSRNRPEEVKRALRKFSEAIVAPHGVMEDAILARDWTSASNKMFAMISGIHSTEELYNTREKECRNQAQQLAPAGNRSATTAAGRAIAAKNALNSITLLQIGCNQYSSFLINHIHQQNNCG